MAKRKLPPDPEATLDQDKEFEFVTSAAASVGTQQDVVQRVGSAIIGGDFSGSPRGLNALDIQIVRAAVSDVASGDTSIAFGRASRAAGDVSIAMGNGARADGASAVAVGQSVEATGDGSAALGYAAVASGVNAAALGNGAQAAGRESLALGSSALAYVDYTLNVGAAPIVKCNGAADPEWLGLGMFPGMPALIFTPVMDLQAVADYVITLPARCHFWPHECGLILSAVEGLTSQPTVRFGIQGDFAKHVAAFGCSLLSAAGRCERFLPDWSGGGETSISCGVTAAGVATDLRGRFYWLGILVEDET